MRSLPGSPDETGVEVGRYAPHAIAHASATPAGVRDRGRRNHCAARTAGPRAAARCACRRSRGRSDRRHGRRPGHHGPARRGRAARTGPTTVWVWSPTPLSPGQRVAVTGRLHTPRGFLDPGASDRAALAASRGAAWELTAGRVEILGERRQPHRAVLAVGGGRADDVDVAHSRTTSRPPRRCEASSPATGPVFPMRSTSAGESAASTTC